MEHVTHTLDPIFDADSRILILGTMPSPKSRAARMYYGHPQNRFWPVLAAVYGEAAPTDHDARRALILRHNLALWDVLHSCDIVGASDASIRNPVPNDIAWLLGQTGIHTVLTTGQTAARLYRALIEPTTGLPCSALPSPSAANARVGAQALIASYRLALMPDTQNGDA